MKRMVSLCLSLLLAWALAVPAAADLIWEPEDDFFETHREDCVYEGRPYYANSPDGAVALRDEPDGEILLWIKNGAELYVNFTYARGGWSIVTLRDEQESAAETLGGPGLGGRKAAWVETDQLTHVYDGVSFQEEYGPFAVLDGDFSGLVGKNVCFYAFPGGALQTQITVEDTPGLGETWTDGTGRQWAACSYYRGIKDTWICLDDPENPELPAADHMPELYPAAEALPQAQTDPAQSGDDGAKSAAVPATGDGFLPLAVGVAAVCAVTGLLLFTLRKKPGTDQ